ncbi:hypothetical protein, partial [Bacillus cereus]|uniref:hypothetical protein n=1 Tax=Bacillus cereus TaxID=1396 RepID=UPI001E5CCC80
EGYAGWERCCILTGRVRNMGKMLHVLQEEYARWERCCMFYRKGTQDEKGVASYKVRVRKMGKMLQHKHLRTSTHS